MLRQFRLKSILKIMAILVFLGNSACGVKGAPLPPLRISAESSDGPVRVPSPTPTPEAH